MATKHLVLTVYLSLLVFFVESMRDPYKLITCMTMRWCATQHGSSLPVIDPHCSDFVRKFYFSHLQLFFHLQPNYCTVIYVQIVVFMSFQKSIVFSLTKDEKWYRINQQTLVFTCCLVCTHIFKNSDIFNFHLLKLMLSQHCCMLTLTCGQKALATHCFCFSNSSA